MVETCYAVTTDPAAPMLTTHLLVPLLSMSFANLNVAMPTLNDYDVVWKSPSTDATGSMPIGNGEVVLNTWVEAKSGDILILIGRTDALSEISRVLKLGQVRVKFTPSPFTQKDFVQHLVLKNGQIKFNGSGDALQLFVDSNTNVIHLGGTFNTPRKVNVQLENWRTEAKQLPANQKESAWSVHDAPFPLIESADVVLPAGTTGPTDIAWYHHNSTSVVPKLWENQSLMGLKGTRDPLLGRTFGGWIHGASLLRTGPHTIASTAPQTSLSLAISTHTAQSISEWTEGIKQQLKRSPVKLAKTRTTIWWNAFWNRSEVFIKESKPVMAIPQNKYTLRVGFDSGGGNRFPGTIANLRLVSSQSASQKSDPPETFSPKNYFAISAVITPNELRPGRIVDKLTAGQNDGFLFDTHPGNSLRLIVGNLELSAPNCLKKGVAQSVGAIYNGETGGAYILVNGKIVAQRESEEGSLITRGYVLQRYVQACQGRGQYPIKFNGGYFCVEPTPFRADTNPDYRKWGDSHWFQNVRHMYHPMLASGDFEMMEPFFKLYEDNRVLAESRTAKYHSARGAYFPETMTVFGTYSGGDYGWDRTGLQPKDVQCPWWDDAWNQGPELVALMLDRWDYTRDASFLKERVVPMAKSVLAYFDSRFKKTATGQIILDPTQVVETYWDGVKNDMPTVAGLRSITHRLANLPPELVDKADRTYFARIEAACPAIPIEFGDAGSQLAPAEKYDKKITNVENGELYAVWPFRVAGVGHPELLKEALSAYKTRKNHLDTGWGYDGNVAATLGLADEAGRILNIKVRNSHPAYRWPATWGPNFDWLPDQNHGGNILNTTHLMLMQADPIEQGGAIYILPAWPRGWDVKFKLRAPGNTTVQCTYESGKITRFIVRPVTRQKDIVFSW